MLVRLVAALFLSSTITFFVPQRALAQIGGNDIAFKRSEHLQRGINVNNWFAQRAAYPPDYLKSYIKSQDFRTIRTLGFDHVRLPIDPAPLLTEPLTNGLNAAHLALLDEAVKEILDNNLNVVLDIHPDTKYKESLKPPANQRSFEDFWAAFATHFASRHFTKVDEDRIFFEILNEPEVIDPAPLTRLEGEVVGKIRAAAPHFTIIAAAGNDSGLADLLNSQPVTDDPNVIYTFHYYRPDGFTQQGAKWSNQWLKPLSGVPYPQKQRDVLSKASSETSLADQFRLNDYALQQWDSRRIEAEISFVRQWSEKHHVPVWCGEFGVIREGPPKGARVAWLHDVRRALEKDKKNRIGWAMWDYCANFGLAEDANGTRLVDLKVLKALGMH
ncbi:MAG: cellulase family glycosylhydrolase [Terriglobales bacterium]|jgi:hypothetical protein